MSTKVFFRNRSTFNNDEQKALEAVCSKENVTADQLKAVHSEKQFRWQLTEASSETTTESKQYPFGLHSVAKGEDVTLQDAVNSAKEHFKTFEGNIKRVDDQEDEEHYVFTKVRG